jgi:hypothetical protein
MYGLPPVVYSGFAVLLSDAVGFIAPLLIDIGVIREPAISAIMADHRTNPILLPDDFWRLGIKGRKISREEAGKDSPFWRFISNRTSET